MYKVGNKSKQTNFIGNEVHQNSNDLNEPGWTKNSFFCRIHKKEQNKKINIKTLNNKWYSWIWFRFIIQSERHNWNPKHRFKIIIMNPKYKQYKKVITILHQQNVNIKLLFQKKHDEFLNILFVDLNDIKY